MSVEAPVADATMWEGSLHSGSLGTFMNRPRVAPDATLLRAAGVFTAQDCNIADLRVAAG